MRGCFELATCNESLYHLGGTRSRGRGKGIEEEHCLMDCGVRTLLNFQRFFHMSKSTKTIQNLDCIYRFDFELNFG